MADTKISALPASTVPLAGTEVLPIVQSSTTKQVSVANLTAGRSFDALGMTLTSTDAGAAAAPLLELYRDSASPAANDTLGEIEFNGEDSAGNKQAYALFHASILSPTSGSEQGQIHFETATAGALTEKMIIGTTNLVINEIGAVFNVRIEGDTDANLFCTDATNSRVGIGTVSPTSKLDVVGGDARIDNGNLVIGTTAKGVTTGSAVNLGFGTNNSTSQATLFSSGGFSVGDVNDPGVGCLRLGGGAATVSSSTGSSTVTISGANTAGADAVIVFNLPGSNTAYIKYVRSSSQIQVIPGASGGVSIADGATSWSAISDERQKENLIPIVDAVEKVSSLRAVTGNYIADATKKSRSFLIAQDVQKVLPEAIDSSNPEVLGLAYTDVIPLLVAAVKEQATTIEAMQTALKNANVAGF